MANENLLLAGGYIFGSLEDAELARGEQKTIAFLEKKIPYDDVETTLKIYHKALGERLFKTPVGYEYLKSMQQQMIERGMDPTRINPIPIFQVYSQKDDEVVPRREPLPDKKVELKRTRGVLRTSILFNVALLFLVIAMFVITLRSDTPNMINYRSAIENEYSSWEQELQEREKIVKEKELELLQQ